MIYCRHEESIIIDIEIWLWCFYWCGVITGKVAIIVWSLFLDNFSWYWVLVDMDLTACVLGLKHYYMSSSWPKLSWLYRECILYSIPKIYMIYYVPWIMQYYGGKREKCSACHNIILSGEYVVINNTYHWGFICSYGIMINIYIEMHL